MKRRLSYKPAQVSPMSTVTTTVSSDLDFGNHSIANAPKREISLKDVMNFIQSLANHEGNSTELRRENEKLMRDNLQLLTEKKELEAKLSKLEKEHTVIEEDYQSLIQIMNRARRMALLQEEEEIMQAPKFKMDKNGNLEKIAK